MKNGKFLEDSHRAFSILIYYSGVRRGEIIKTIREQFKLLPNYLMYDVGERLKHSRKTPSLPIPLSAPYVNFLKEYILTIPKGSRIFDFTGRTGYNIISRVWTYPHHFRLSRITWFFSPHPELNRPHGYSIAEVRNWTGLSLKALNYYLGLVSLKEMGAGLSGSNGIGARAN